MKLFVLAVLALFGHAALAAKVPQPTAADQRIRQVVYSSSEVYEVSGSYRLTTTIEFEKGETVQYLTLGDTIAWQAHPMGHRVHLKPVEPRAVTNLTVVTDRRTYYFRLTSAAPTPVTIRFETELANAVLQSSCPLDGSRPSTWPSMFPVIATPSSITTPASYGWDP